MQNQTSTQAPQNRLVAFPAKEEIALTPALWLACGVLSYNFALLARHPMRILAPTEIPNLNPTRAEFFQRGFAVAVDASTLVPSVRNAMLQISRTLLAALNFTCTLQGHAGREFYFLIEFHGGADLPLPDDEPQKPLPPSPTATAPQPTAIPSPAA